MADGLRQRLVHWMPAGLAVATLVTLLGALLSRGGTSLGFLAAFVVLLPAALATMLVRWAPGGVAAREACRHARNRRRMIMLGVALLVSAVVTLLLGVAWSGTRIGGMLLVAGVLLLPPAVLLGLLVYLGRRSVELVDEVEAGERVEQVASAHWGVFVPALAILAVTALLAVGPFGVIGLGIAAGLYLIVFPGLATSALAAFVNSEAVLTDRRLYLAAGLLRQRSVGLRRERIGAAGVKQNWLGVALDYGKLTVVDADGLSMVVPGLKDPEALAQWTRQNEHGEPRHTP